MIAAGEMLANEAAKQLRMNPNFLVRLLAEGRVHGRKLMGRWFITSAEVERINAQKRVVPRKRGSAPRTYTHWGL
jgi:hypothetical protein